MTTTKQSDNQKNQTILNLNNDNIGISQNGHTETLPLGFKTLASKYFRHNPPTPSELEGAITEAEDELMKYYRNMLPDTELITNDPVIRHIASYILPVVTGKTTLTATDIEIIFGRLGAIITGRPASMDVLPTDNIFIAQVLIIREILAHLKFREVVIID